MLLWLFKASSFARRGPASVAISIHTCARIHKTMTHPADRPQARETVSDSHCANGSCATIDTDASESDWVCAIVWLISNRLDQFYLRKCIRTVRRVKKSERLATLPGQPRVHNKLVNILITQQSIQRFVFLRAIVALRSTHVERVRRRRVATWCAAAATGLRCCVWHCRCPCQA